MNFNYILCLYFVFYHLVKKQIYNRIQNMNIFGVQTCLDGVLTGIGKKLFKICIYNTWLGTTKPMYEFICIKSLC